MELWRESVSPTTRTQEQSVHAEDAPTGPILWEREGLVPSLSLSWAARTALEGGPSAPRDEFTLRALPDERRQPREFRTPLQEDIVNFLPEEAPNLDRDWFLMTLRKAWKRAAGGPFRGFSVITKTTAIFFNEMAVVKGEIPGPVAEATR